VWVTRYGNLVVLTGEVSGTAAQKPPDGYQINIFDGAPAGLAPSRPVIGHGGLSMGKWGTRPIEVNADGLTIVKGVSVTASWTLHVHASWHVD